MATSQNFTTSNQYVNYNIEVITNSQNISNNTSNVTIKVWFFRINQGYTTYGSGSCYCEINGTIYSESVTSSQKITSTPIVLFTKTLTISHENDGSKSIWISSKIDMNTPLTSNYQGFMVVLPTISRSAQYINADDFTDEQNPQIYFNNSGGFKLQLKMEAGGNDHLIVRDNIYSTSPYTFSLTDEERNILRKLCSNSNTLSVRFTVGTYMSNSSSPTNYSYGDKTMTITNANPVFLSSQLTYNDINTTSKQITENDQLIIRNNSNLEINFTSATAEKSSTISKYQIIFNGQTVEKTSSGAYNLGKIDSSSDLNLQIKAIDSRGNSTTISKIITILDWTTPIINATAKRINNFENETILFSNVQISNLDGKNFLNSLEYRTKITNQSTWSNWTNFSDSTNTSVYLDNIFAWNLQIKVADRLGSSELELTIAKGIPLMFFDTKKLSVGINKFPSEANTFETTNLSVSGNTYLNSELMIFDEGYWTPEIRSRSGTNPTNSVSYRQARYKRINNLCYVTFHGKWNISNAGTDYAMISGLPYISSNNMNGQSLCLHEMYGSINRDPTRCGIIPDNSSQINLQGENGAYASQWSTGDVWIGFSGIYLIAT